MMTRRGPTLAAMTLLLGCNTIQTVPQPVEGILRDGAGVEVGRVTLRDREERVQVHVRVTGLSSGLHGIHLHETASCVAPGFQSAGAHLNPGGTMKHGHLNPAGPHLGDLGNLSVGSAGWADTTLELVGAIPRTGGLRAILGANGIAVVVHAARDDEVTDPSGNSGARVACAEIKA